MTYIKELEKVEERIDKYWSTDEIDVDLANAIVDNCESLVYDVKENRAIMKVQAKQIQSYLILLKVIGDELGYEQYEYLKEKWNEAVKKEMVE